jgi:hypothetical protein
LNRRPRHPQNAGCLDLRLAGGEHPASFGKPGTHERLRTTDVLTRAVSSPLTNSVVSRIESDNETPVALPAFLRSTTQRLNDDACYRDR